VDGELSRAPTTARVMRRRRTASMAEEELKELETWNLRRGSRQG
jgi:hypothetical protein